ncbi:MAG: rhomboid family intramembrane serine protease [Alphaproteobacteria bacterium]|nr:rhomboid family intramembrane serine protease [Alphaproteobacteria bacterium]
MNRNPPPFERSPEPLFLVPIQVPAFAGLFVLIHVALMLVPLAYKSWAYASFALVPVRFLSDDSGMVALSAANLLTHGFLHYDWVHVLVNCGLLMAAAGPVNRNCGAFRMTILFSLCVIAGGLSHVAAYWGQNDAVIGASAGAAGLLAAAMRYRSRRLSMGEIVAPITHGPVLALTLFWIGINLALFLWDVLGGGAMSGLATIAHIGGYLAGLFLAPVFVLGARPARWTPRIVEPPQRPD